MWIKAWLSSSQSVRVITAESEAFIAGLFSECVLAGVDADQSQHNMIPAAAISKAENVGLPCWKGDFRHIQFFLAATILGITEDRKRLVIDHVDHDFDAILF